MKEFPSKASVERLYHYFLQEWEGDNKIGM